MQTLIPTVAGLGIAVALSSVGSIIAVLILLELPRGLRRAVGFVLGWVAMIAVITIVLALFPSVDFHRSQTTPSRVTSVVEIIIGCALVVWAVVIHRRPAPATPRDPIPEWLTGLLSRNWFLSAVAGAFMLTYSLTVVAALEVLKAHVSRIDRVFAMLVFGAASIVTLLAPILYAAAAPERAAHALRSAKRWLTVKWPQISAALLAIVGALIVCKAGFDLLS